MYLQLCFFGVVHFTNLTALSNWAKSAFASLTAVVILGRKMNRCCTIRNDLYSLALKQVSLYIQVYQSNKSQRLL